MCFSSLCFIILRKHQLHTAGAPLPKYFTLLGNSPRGERGFPERSLLTLASFKVDILRSYLFTSARTTEGLKLRMHTCDPCLGLTLEGCFLTVDATCSSEPSGCTYGCVFTGNSPNGLRCPLSKYRTRIFQKCSHKLLWALVFPPLALLSLSC